jgi:hypothetical protein
MSQIRLVLRGLIYYWRSNLAVVLGVATALAVLGGALLVGESVRGSLRDLLLQQLGRTDLIVVSSGFFRDALAADLQADQAFATSFISVCPVIVAQAGVSDQASGRRVARVAVYGVDERFWRFHGLTRSPADDSGREALVSGALASEIGVAPGGAVLLRVERPSAIPIESLHGRKDDVGRTLRLTVKAVIGPSELGEFSLRPEQGRVKAIFVPLERLQQELELEGRVNTLLVSAQAGNPGPVLRERLEDLIRRRAALEDLGLNVRAVGLGSDPPTALSVENARGLLDQPRVAAVDRAAAAASMKTRPVFTYLANTLRSENREVPYSLVTAIDLSAIVPADQNPAPSLSVSGVDGSLAPVVVNDWTARDLGIGPGARLTLEYYVWEEPGRLLTRSADFRVAAVVPIKGAAADRNLAPVYPGITESENLGDWDPPFPIDLRRVRKIDEEYWHQYRTTPKAFIPFDVGRQLWQSRYGDRTSMRLALDGGASNEAIVQFTERLHAAADPLALGLSVQDIRTEGLAASRGATDFGEYFTYFSFFLVCSALLLAALFFRLGVEQRAREIGLLRAVGYTTARVRRFFAGEGLLLAAAGSAVGTGGAIGYAWLMMTGLGSWWAGAVGTDALRLHVSPAPLAVGALGASVAAVACIWWTMRGLAPLSERSLLAGSLAGDERARSGPRGSTRRTIACAVAFALLAAGLMSAAAVGAMDKSGAFFGAGTALLIACLCLVGFILRRPARPLEGHGWWSVVRLGGRNAGVRPGRSVLAIAVIAAATFILISVEAFRRVGVPATDPHSGVGGYPVLVELLLPLAHDPNGPEGRELLGLADSDPLTIEPFRLLPGDDASCLNLYEPRNPRILGVSRRLIESGRFAFQASLASTDDERRNPWLLLNQPATRTTELVVPVIADANSMTYVLHKQLGDDIVINREGRPVRLHLVAALDDSIFQSELLMSDANFQLLFPDQNGFRVLLVQTSPDDAARVAAAIEEGGRDIGADATSTTERLAEFHRVENTYISTFQMLGGLGLLVGTVGLAAVLLRNVMERRRDLALLGAVGYRKTHVFAIVLAENVLLLGWGLAIGTFCALVAVIPAIADRGGRTPMTAGGWLLLAAVFVVGLASSIAATGSALRTPLLRALRAE